MKETKKKGKVKTMNVLKRFTIQNLKLNKKRTIVTIIGVMLSTALICAVSGMTTSTQKTIVDAEIQFDGNYHIMFQNVPETQQKYIKENTEVKSYFVSKTLGYAKLDNSKNDYKPYAYVMEFGKSALENSAIRLIEGKLPKSSNEIVIPEHVKTNGQVNINVGDKITLDIGKRETAEGSVLSQKDEYQEDIGEELVETTSKEYTVVGIVERPSYILEDFSAPGYTFISYLEKTENLDNANISVVFKTPKDYKETSDKITKTIKDNTGIEIQIITNTDLLRYQGGMSDNTLKVLYSIASVVIVIILISSVFVIRNSFSISVSEKTRQYGMMTSVGATSKQIRKSVLFEGVIIGIIAIPLGILCGIIAILILIWIVNMLLGDMLNGFTFTYSVPLIPILISVVVSFITIYLSCIIPARRASKISPIVAIRGNEDIKIKAKKIKTSKLIKKIFGIGGVIASKNLKRNKKKYRTTVISLVVSISIFISLSSFLDYGKRMTGVYYVDLNYNVYIRADENAEELYKEISKMDNINNSAYAYYLKTSTTIDYKKYGQQDYINAIEEGKNSSTYSEEENTRELSIAVGIYNDEYFKTFIKELGLKESDYKTAVILEDDYIQYGKDNKMKVARNLNVKEGDTLTITTSDGDKDLKIAKISDNRPMGCENSYPAGGYVFVSKEYALNNLVNSSDDLILGGLMIDSSNPNKFEETLQKTKTENIKYSNISITNYNEYKEQEDRLILLVSIFLYGFITVITLIGVTNIFNTITTNMILRSKEFANLKSIGMTSKEFNKMIRLESIMYGMKSLLIGIPIGLVGSFYIYKSFTNSVDFGYFVPWTSILISVLFVFIIVGATMKYSLNKINKQNIIETIRQDNI